MNRIDFALLLLRLVFGLSLAYHGVNKVKNGLAGTSGWFSSIGLKWPMAQAITAAATEIGAGLMMAAGFVTPLSSAAVIATMLVAIVTVHWRVGFFIFLPNGGWEYCASIAAVAAVISLTGAGSASLDHGFGWEFGTSTSVGAVILGVALAVLHLLASYRPKAS